MKRFSITTVIALSLATGLLANNAHAQNKWTPPKIQPPKLSFPKIENPFKKKQYVEPIELTDRRRRPLFSNPLANRPLVSENTKNWFREFDNRSRTFWKNTGQNISAFHKANTQRFRESTSRLFKPFDFSKGGTPKDFIERANDSMSMRRESTPRVGEMPKIKRGDTTNPKIRY